MQIYKYQSVLWFLHQGDSWWWEYIWKRINTVVTVTVSIVVSIVVRNQYNDIDNAMQTNYMLSNISSLSSIK